MNIKDLTKRVKRVVDLENKFMIACSSAAELIQEVSDFELSVGPVSGDGIIVLNQETSNVACILDCLEVIRETGTLTEDQHWELTF